MARVAQAGAITVRGDGSAAEVLIVRAKKDPTKWIFPKGHIELGETAAEAATRELAEEAGVVGEVLRAVGTSTFPSGEDLIEVAYFLLRFISTVPPLERRETRWSRFDEARRLITFEDAQRLIDATEQMLAGDHA
jgi:8-oxo-dGTP pyrophosphatase MutT (NUDIX family)